MPVYDAGVIVSAEPLYFNSEIAKAVSTTFTGLMQLIGNLRRGVFTRQRGHLIDLISTSPQASTPERAPRGNRTLFAVPCRPQGRHRGLRDAPARLASEGMVLDESAYVWKCR
ncbi:hypothetical protein [Mesorhizobium sophorae]|uniref:hypothetical protein n=1 Tax=Mesorhizobium sophorae TaxID=1300294 RepID=UPI001180D833|nr:hypothetical protein [Mesorhizobium sophorae]